VDEEIIYASNKDRRYDTEVALELLLVCKTRKRICELTSSSCLNTNGNRLHKIIEKLCAVKALKSFVILPKGAKLNPNTKKRKNYAYQTTDEWLKFAVELNNGFQKLKKIVSQ